MLVKSKLMESVTGVSQPEENLHTKISHSASDHVFSHAGLGSCEHPHPMVPNTCVFYPQRCARENQLSAANSSGCGTLCVLRGFKPAVLAEKMQGWPSWGDIPSLAGGAGIAGVRALPSCSAWLGCLGKSEFSKNLGHGVTECTVNLFGERQMSLLGGFF